MANGLEQEQYKSKYTGSEIDGLLDFVNENQNDLATLQDIPTVPSKTSELTNDNEFITNTVNNLLNYYLKTEVYSKTEAYAKTEVYAKTETYTKAEIGTLISASASGGFIKVNELPTEDINTKAIYLVPYTGSKTGNLYEEYIYIDDAWEMIGTTKLDLSNYVTTTDLSTALGDYVTSTALNTALADYLTSASFNTQIANYYNKTEITGLLSGKVDNDKIGAANGVASLGNDGKVPSSQLPEQQSGGVSDFNDLTNRPQKEVTSIASLIDPVPIPTHNQVGSVGFTPCGTIIAYYGEIAPIHYLACDGSEYNKTDYPELWTHLSSLTDTTPYIVDGDNTKFKVPDLRGEFLRGTGTNGHTNQGSGANVGVHQNGTSIPSVQGSGAISLGIAALSDSDSFSSIGRIYVNSTKTDEWGGTFTTRPTNTSVLYCIAYKDIYVDARFDYSTQEKVVGTWIDGKPIYQRTIVSSSVQNNSTIPLSIANVSDYISCEYIASRTDGAFITNSFYVNSNDRFVGALTDSGFYISYGNSAYTKISITVQYTKTTD